MSFEAARVQRDDRGGEVPEYPQSFIDLQAAYDYVEGTPVSSDGNRPWVRDTSKPWREQFLMIGGRLKEY